MSENRETITETLEIVPNSVSEASLANLRPWKEGVSGNPGGRPKTAEVAAQIREFLKSKHGNRTRLQILIQRLYRQDPKTLLAYAYGKPVETHLMADLEVSGQAGYSPRVLAAAREIAKDLLS